MKLTRDERETGILFNEADDLALIWTTSPVFLRAFTRRFGAGTPNGPDCMEWLVPKRWISVRKKRKIDPTTITEAQKAARAAFVARKAK